MGLRTGEQYLEGLRDGREIWIGGAKVEDVTTAPGFRSMAQTVAQYYDFQNDPAVHDLVTYETPDGDRAHLSFIEPRSKDDLRRRAAAFAAWADVTGGMFGRSPDYMNAALMAVAAAKKHWGQKDPVWGQRAEDIYLRCRREDLALTHTLVVPMVDRFKTLAEQEPYINAGVVEEQADGIVIRGARIVGTLAPFCDENLSFLMPPILADGEEIYGLGFQTPVNHPGLKWICRDTYDLERSHFDYPLSGRLEEMDTVAVFEDAFIPWEMVFDYQDAEIHNRTAPAMHFFQSLGHHVLIKNISKTRLLLGIAHLMAESSQISKFINVQERLGDIVTCLQTMESLAIAAVEGAEEDPENGLFYAHEPAILSALRLFPEWYVRIIGHIKQLGGGGFIAAPDEATFEALGQGLERYFRGAETDAHDRVALFRLAWDVVGSSWAGRQDLYERFFFGDTQRQKATMYTLFNLDEAVAMVGRILQEPEAGTPFPVPSLGS
jgi:4-hydroxyphenylacetate 3-monooxygenase